MKLSISATRIRRDTVTVGSIPVFILVVLIIISNTPILARNISNVIYYGLVIAFFLSTLNLYCILRRKTLITILLLLAYFMMQLLYRFLSISSAPWAYYSTIFKFFFFMLAMLLIVEHLSVKQKIVLLGVSILSMVFTMIDNIRLYNLYGATRFVHLFQQQRFSTNSVNTTFVTAVLFLNAVLFVWFLRTNKTTIKVVISGLSIFNLYFSLVIAQRMMILVLAVIMYPLLLLFRRSFSRGHLLGTLIGIVIVGLMIIQYEKVINYLDTIIGSGRMSLRFSQISNYISSRNIYEAGGTVSGRMRLMMRSMESWRSSILSFIFGVGDHRGYDIIGNHSEIIDECARYGILGLTVIIPLTVAYLKHVKRISCVQIDSPLSKQISVIEVLFLIRAFLGSVYEATIAIQLFIVVPMAFSLFQMDNSKF